MAGAPSMGEGSLTEFPTCTVDRDPEADGRSAGRQQSREEVTMCTDHSLAVIAINS